jgi:glutamate/aspartate transport system substrate-binding protein
MKKHLLAVAVAALAAGSALAQANDTLAKIKSTGSITLGVRESSAPWPIRWATASTWASTPRWPSASSRTSRSNWAKLEVKYQPVTSQNRIPLVQNGTVDSSAAPPPTTGRQKDVAFAVTTYVEEVRIAVKANSGITGIKDLNGKTVATTTGTTSVQTLRKNKRADGLTSRKSWARTTPTAS